MEIVLVPGNHDLNWTLAEEAYDLCDALKLSCMESGIGNRESGVGKKNSDN
ncbi:hypothetical protein [Moorena sp. SIO3H5]|uniref:hypothetical protein n=1 Tax=Moorena sp. SIO3H5 TaxID=2607834 RepID=UPI0013B5ED71|nr:hypothetical protein [Moorena sp. SIO3H5]NEO68379.1 hypothetical protein [Moorena sp. SIO3H5]